MRLNVSTIPAITDTGATLHEQMDVVADYMSASFLGKIHPNDSTENAQKMRFPLELSLSYLTDIDFVVNELVAAYHNKCAPFHHCSPPCPEAPAVVIPTWDAERYAKRLPKAPTMPTADQQETLDLRYPGLPGALHECSQPTLVVDKYGVVLAWLLPKCLPERLQVGLRLCYIFTC